MMNEKQFSTNLVKQFGLMRPRGVLFKHADLCTKGIPDVSLTYSGQTLWLELKVLRRDAKKLCPVQLNRKEFSRLQLLIMTRLDLKRNALYIVRFAPDKIGLASPSSIQTCLHREPHVLGELGCFGGEWFKNEKEVADKILMLFVFM